VSEALISILMPAKNAMPYLIACLDSIIQQTYSNWELIVVDDHSTDSTPDILSSYSLQDSRIKVSRLESDAGIIAALRLALPNSKGKYITRMDGDDLMPKHKLESMVSELQSNGTGHVVTGKVKYFRDGGISQGYSKYEQWINERIDLADHWQHIYKECVIPSP